MVQMLVEPGAPDANLARAVEWISEAARQGADAALLPEALDCGWTHPSARALAGSIPGGTGFERLREAAANQRVMVCAGLIERCAEQLFNAAVLISPQGQLLLHHRKIHELDFARKLYACGDRLGVVETHIGRVGIMICADAFADGLVISRALGQMGASLILSPCAWAVPPERDLIAEPYGQLWRDSYGPPARESRMTIAGCSNVGPVTAGEWTGWQCIGNSMIVGPDGQAVYEAPCGPEAELMQIVEIESRAG
jgi:predicted amidohydrolase